MPSAIWTGSLSFGLVVIPVRLHPAIRKRTVRFREIDSKGRRIRRLRVAEADIDWSSRAPLDWPSAGDEPPMAVSPGFDRARPTPMPPSTHPDPVHSAGGERVAGIVNEPLEVPYEEIRKGFEVAPGQYVSMTRDEVRELAPERSRALEVERFVDLASVDPIYFESRYYVTPQPDAIHGFQLLNRAMAEAGRIAIGSFTMRQRHHLCAIRPFGGVMLLATMAHADEVLPVEWSPYVEVEPSERELKMARLLVESMSGPFEPELYGDEHRQRLLDAIARRTPQAPAPDSPSPARVLDLMAALEASVKAARAARRETGTPPKRVQKRRSGGTSTL